MAELPDAETLRHLAPDELHNYLCYKCQILLPRFDTCPVEFLRQVIDKEKKVLPLYQTRHFYLTDHAKTKARSLTEYCMENRVLRQYIPDGGVQDRDFLVRVLATLDLEGLIEIQQAALCRKYQVIGKDLQPVLMDIVKEEDLYLPEAVLPQKQREESGSEDEDDKTFVFSTNFKLGGK